MFFEQRLGRCRWQPQPRARAWRCRSVAKCPSVYGILYIIYFVVHHMPCLRDHREFGFQDGVGYWDDLPAHMFFILVGVGSE
jgi:hypothetical protein